MVVLAFIGFWPNPVDQPVNGEIAGELKGLHARGVPESIDYSFVEASANMALFVPVGIVASLTFTKKRWWQVAAFGLLISGCIELGQQVFLHERVASPLDLVTNTVGSVIGILTIRAAVRELKRRRLNASRR